MSSAEKDHRVIHLALSECPFGEEDPQLIKSITTEVALNLPWTSQLRLATREKSFQSLLPHVWSRLQQYPTGELEEEDFGSLLFDDDGWRKEYMIQNWTMTRFHMERENKPAKNMSKSLFNTLQLIMDRISEMLGLDLENEGAVRSPWDIVNSDEEKQPSHPNDDFLSSSSSNVHSSSVHSKFSVWVATNAAPSSSKLYFQDLLLDLCSFIGSGGYKATRKISWDDLPLNRVADELCQLDRGCMGETARRGRALILGSLQSNHNLQVSRLDLDPLPERLWNFTTLITNDEDTQGGISLEQILQNYLSTVDLPNVNAVVIFLWTYHRDKLSLIKKISHWLPIEPIVPLVRRFLTEGLSDTRKEVEIEIAMNFILSLDWEKGHLDSMIGHDVPIPDNAKELSDFVMQRFKNVRKKIRTTSNDHSSISNKRLKTEPTTRYTRAQVIWQLFGETKLDEGHQMTTKDEGSDDIGPEMESDQNSPNRDMYDSDTSFDESDDRILLL